MTLCLNCPCMFLYPTVSTGCPYGPDDVWNIVWPNTPGGSMSSQPCPGGVDAIGMLFTVGVIWPYRQ